LGGPKAAETLVSLGLPCTCYCLRLLAVWYYKLGKIKLIYNIRASNYPI